MAQVIRRFFNINSRYYHTTSINNAGHSKWANIKHIKAQKDGQRSIIFTRLARQIRLAIQEGGSSNPSINSSLKSAIDEALRKNMPMSTIQNNIKRFEASKAQLKKHLLEFKVLNKVFGVCIVYTDNITGNKMLMAPLLKKAGGAFVDSCHLFDDKGVIEAIFTGEKCSSAEQLEEICTEDAIDAGAEEVEVVDLERNAVNFFCNPIELDRIRNDLVKKGYSVESSEHVFMPKVSINLSADEYKAYQSFNEKLKVFDGVEEVYDNINHDVS